MMWIVIYMARNPECQRKMQQEIQDILGKILESLKEAILPQN